MFCKSATCGWLTFVLSRWKKRTSKLHVWRTWNSRSGRKEMVNPMDVFYSYMIYYKSDIYIWGAFIFENVQSKAVGFFRLIPKGVP